MCRPGHGSSRDPSAGGHMGPLLHDMGWCFGSNGDWRRAGLPPAGRGGACPLQGDRAGKRWGAPGERRGVVTPLYGSNAGSAQQTGRCGHWSLRKGEQAASTSQASGAQRSVCASGCEGWAEIGAEIIPKGAINFGRSLSQPAADSSLCTREPWRRGMRIAASLRSSQ